MVLSGRSRFWRFGVIDEGVIGSCEARRYRVWEARAAVEKAIASDPAALLDLEHPGDERTEVAYLQRLAWIEHAG